MERIKEIIGRVVRLSIDGARLAATAVWNAIATAASVVARFYVASPLKRPVDMVRATSLGRWLEGHIVRAAMKIYGIWRSTVTIYRKLTSPPPDPLMAALMMQGQQIDIDEDPTALKGNRLFLMIAAFFTIMVLWAYFTELDSVVRAEGRIVPPSSVQLVQNRLPGSVVSIRVALGDRVEKDDILFRLEDEEVNANFDDNEITRIASLARVARLRAESKGADVLTFPDWMERRESEAVAAERALFEQRQSAIKHRLTVIDQQIRENESIANNLKQKIDIYAPLVEDGHEPRLTLIDLQGQFDQATLAAERARTEYTATVSNFRAEAARELSDVKTQADQADAREDAFRAKVQNAEVRAPVNGVVSAVHVKTEGAVVQAGTVLAEIVPDEQTILVEARVFSEDVASVYPGQIAQISLSAYDVSRYGNLEGRVQRVASNTTQEEGIPPYYLTMIEVPLPRFSKSDAKVEIVPGMTTVVDIIGSKRTVLSYIFTPLDRAAGIVFREQ